MRNKNFFPLITFVTCATVAILYWQFIYIPVKAEISNFNAEIKKIEDAKKEIENLQARYKNLEEIVETLAENLAEAQALLPPEMNAEKFIAEIYTAAENKKILINSVQAGEISTSDSVQRQSIKIRMDADYISLLNFIREILDGERLANLDNFSISSDGTSNILACELEFSIFATVEE